MQMYTYVDRRVRVTRNKSDGLQANTIRLHEYRNGCITAVSETWLTLTDADLDLTISSFGAPVRLDRETNKTGKSQGGEACIYY